MRERIVASLGRILLVTQVVASLLLVAGVVLMPRSPHIFDIRANIAASCKELSVETAGLVALCGIALLLWDRGRTRQRPLVAATWLAFLTSMVWFMGLGVVVYV